MLKVNARDPDLKRKGRILAIILLSLGASVFVLAAFNLVHGGTQYNFANGAFISLILGLFMLNRFGLVHASSSLTVVLMAMTPFTLIYDSLVGAYLAMVIPVLVASYLFAPWSGFVVAALMIVGAFVFDIASLSLLTLVLIASFVYLFADSLDRAYRENRYGALHDNLTGLPNRALFVERIQQAIDRLAREQNLCAVLFMDLDRFKLTNDSLGHESGDKLLTTVARRLQSCLRRGDTVARLSGDEFAVLLDGIANVHDAVRIAERIAKTLRVPIELGERHVFTSTSIGISLGTNINARPDNLLRNADVAMYEAKREGKARFKVYDSSMHVQALGRLELENDLRRAIEGGELRVHYQPKVLLDTGGITGVEALVRWEHPERGLISPGEFIPLAEETGLIVPLGQWVLRESCLQAREWQRRYPAASSLVTSVNLSLKQFQQPNLVQELAEILRENGLNSRLLQLEITESMVTDDTKYAVGLLQELKEELNVQLAIDDFGKGYSSLASLKRFPLDELKIDKAFVDGLGKDEQDTAIVQLVINLAHTVGMQAVAEGVETAEQLAQLREMGCDQAQGYYFWRPLTSEAMSAVLADLPSDQTLNMVAEG